MKSTLKLPLSPLSMTSSASIKSRIRVSEKINNIAGLVSPNESISRELSPEEIVLVFLPPKSIPKVRRI